MLYNILKTGRSGLNAMQNKLDATADNIANVDTIGYKKKNIGFQELLTNSINQEEVLLGNNALNTGINAGVKSGISTINYKQGALYPSHGKFHMAIEGNGFFGVIDRNDDLVLTRNGEFHLNEDMTVSDSNGNFLDIDYNIPVNRWGNGEISISENGEINLLDDNNKMQKLGTVKMYYPEVLDKVISIDSNGYFSPLGINLYNSIDNPEYFGKIIPNMLERSNVELSESMVDMITAQRAYSMNARVVSTTDEVLTIVNNIKR